MIRITGFAILNRQVYADSDEGKFIELTDLAWVRLKEIALREEMRHPVPEVKVI